MPWSPLYADSLRRIGRVFEPNEQCLPMLFGGLKIELRGSVVGYSFDSAHWSALEHAGDITYIKKYRGRLEKA